MNTVEMVIVTRFRFWPKLDIAGITIILCVIFKDSLVPFVQWALEKIKDKFL